MGLVDIRGISALFFLTSVIFIVGTLSLYSMAILRGFQIRKRSAITYLIAGVISTIVFAIIINQWP